MGITADFPTLSGQHADYLERSLDEYRKGGRKNPIMAGFAAQLSDTDLREISRFIKMTSSGDKAELAKVPEQLRRRTAEQCRQRQRRLPAAKVEFHGAPDAIEAGAEAFGAGASRLGNVLRRVDADAGGPSPWSMWRWVAGVARGSAGERVDRLGPQDELVGGQVADRLDAQCLHEAVGDLLLT